MSTDPTIEDALHLLGCRAWFAAHEALERAWMQAEGARRRILQATIHATVSLVHLQRDNPRGAISQWRKARTRLGDDDPAAVGLPLGEWLCELSRFYDDIRLEDVARTGCWTVSLPDPERWPAPRG